MLLLDAETIRHLVSISRVIAALEQAFRDGCNTPPRQVLQMPGAGEEKSLLVMPVFGRHGDAAVKLVTVFPRNPAKGLPTIQGAIVVFATSGAPEAVLDGSTVTQLRTGAASALASKYLSRPDSSHLVLIGTGALAPALAAAHCAVRPITRISVWGRRPERAAATVAAVRSVVSSAIHIAACTELRDAVVNADIVSCATSSTAPVLQGKWLKPGTFVDLVGSFSPTKRESDDDVVRTARIFVDTFEGALSEAGDLVDPLNRGVIARHDIQGELADLVKGRVTGRLDSQQITLFKSVGTALEDLATARLVVELARAQEG